jgi:hypothetical protein
LRAAAANWTDGGGFAHAAAVAACKRSIRVVKEIRFSRGVPDNIMYTVQSRGSQMKSF